MNRREAEELLPWYVAGVLTREEEQAVQAFIDSGEISPEELDEMAFVSEALGRSGPEEPRYDPQILQRVLDRLDQVPQESANARSADEPVVVVRERGRRKRREGSWFSPLLETLQWSATPPLARIAIGAQFALLLALAVAFTVGEDTDTGPGDYEVVSGAVSGDYTITFRPGATEAQIRSLLLENRATIIAGPSAIGLYTIALDDDVDASEIAGRLEASGLVTFIQRAPQP
jgi:hypothetical protein